MAEGGIANDDDHELCEPHLAYSLWQDAGKNGTRPCRVSASMHSVRTKKKAASKIRYVMERPNVRHSYTLP